MLELVLPSYVRLNQRRQRPRPHAALQAWLPVLPKDTPCKNKKNWTKTLLTSPFFRSFSTVLTWATQVFFFFFFQWLFIEPISEAKLGAIDGLKKWLQVVVTCFLFIIIIVLSMTSIIIAIIYKNENPMVCLLALWVSKCFFSLRPAVILYMKKMDFPYFLCS